MIRGRKPQAYNAATKETDGLFIPAASIDFPDQEDLETKMTTVEDNVSTLQEQTELLEETINRSLPVPKQLGTVVYNGMVQAPVWDVQTSRILISGDITGTDATTYNATATLLNGNWENDSLSEEQPIQWTISKKKIPKPFVSGVLIADGTLQNVQLCDFNSQYCEIEGQTQGRTAGSYNISVKITNRNVIWDDDTSGSLPLTWRIVTVTNSSGNDSALTGLTATVSTLQNSVTTLAEEVADNRNNIATLMSSASTPTATGDCGCTKALESLEGRIAILEAFMGSGGEISDMSAVISALLRNVIRLENSVKDISDEDLEVETTILNSKIDEALAKAVNQSDIDTLTDLKQRVQNIIKLKKLENDLSDIADDINDKTNDIKDIINNNGDLNSAKEKIKEIKDDLNDILGKYDEDIKEKAEDTVKDLLDKIEQLKTDIARKEVQQNIIDIETKIATVQQKIDNGEDPSDIIAQIEELINTAKETAGPYKLPFEKDRLTSLENDLNDLKKEYEIVQKLDELDKNIKDINTNADNYTDEQISEKIDSADDTLQNIKDLYGDLGTDKYDNKIKMLEDDLSDVKDAFWKRQTEKELTSIKEQLEDITTAINSADVDNDDLTQWNTDIARIEGKLEDTKTAAEDKGITLSNLSDVIDTLANTKEALRTAIFQRTINGIEKELDDLREDMEAGTITYDEVNNTLDTVDQEISTVKNSNPPAGVTSSLNMVTAKVNTLRQLNEDMKIYLEVKPALAAIKNRIYDEDLDVLWSEVNEQEKKVNDYGGTSSWVTDLKNDINEIKDILNSFGVNNTLENFLDHLSMALDIIVTTEEFEPTATDYDEAKLDLERLEKCVVTIENDEMLTFPSFYSLAYADKAYMLENNLRKLRRKVITTEDTNS